MSTRVIFGLLLGLLFWTRSAAAQAEPSFNIRADSAASGWRPVVVAQHLLADPALHDALDAGLPLRFTLRVELWKKRIFDRLVDDQEIHAALIKDPLSGHYELDIGDNQFDFDSIPRAETALQAALRPQLRPAGTGRFYYLASLQVETLSLSDLEELRRWLRGEAQPAVTGNVSPEHALAAGVRRILVRVIGLPTRHFEARSRTFRQ